MAKRVNVTISRNDVRPEGFKRWTVYADGVAVYDIEATTLRDGASLIGVFTADDARRELSGWDGTHRHYIKAGK